MDQTNASLPSSTKAKANAPSRFAAVARWALETFGPLLVFYGVEHGFGLRAAIVTSALLSIAVVAWQIHRDRKISRFTGFVATTVVVFGILDLTYQTAFFIKLEPVLGNAATAAFFLGSVLWKQPVLFEIAERAAGRPLDKARGYLTAWTIAWGFFFVARAGAFLWMAYNVSVDTVMIVRSTLGPVSFFAMIGVEMAIRYAKFGRRAFGKQAASGDAMQPAGAIVAKDV